MYQTFTMQEKIKQISIMLIPILITQLGMFAMVFFNTIMSGRYNASDLAGVAIGSSIWNPVFTGLSGILMAVSPIAAQRFGEKRNKEVTSIVKNGVYLGFIIAIIVIVSGSFLLDPVLDSMNLPAGVEGTARSYLAGLSFGIIPLFVFNVLRSFIYALGKTRVVMIILFCSLPINFFLIMSLFSAIGAFRNWVEPAEAMPLRLHIGSSLQSLPLLSKRKSHFLFIIFLAI